MPIKDDHTRATVAVGALRTIHYLLVRSLQENTDGPAIMEVIVQTFRHLEERP